MHGRFIPACQCAWLQSGQPGQQAESQHAARTDGDAIAATGMRREMARLMARMIFMPGIGAADRSVTPRSGTLA
jgi:hypothetical protein